jgi:hypothetical protein
MKILIVLVALLLSGSPALCVDEQTLSLTGAEAIQLPVWVGENVAKAGLTAAAVKTAVELKLRRNGVPIREEDASTPIPVNQRMGLFVMIYANKVSGSMYAYTVQFNLMQRVKLERDPAIEVSASTWSWIAASGMGDKAEIRDTIDEGAEKFANDWLKVHAK